MKKIKKRSSEYGIPVEKIIYEIERYDTALIPFVVDPKKQNIYEKIAIEMIEGIDGVSDLIHLPAAGKEALFIFNGGVKTKGEFLPGEKPEVKSIDIQWSFRGFRVYASHKYTNESGGAQDNQYIDLQLFLKEANRTRIKNIIFVAIADGDYYKSWLE